MEMTIGLWLEIVHLYRHGKAEHCVARSFGWNIFRSRDSGSKQARKYSTADIEHDWSCEIRVRVKAHST